MARVGVDIDGVLYPFEDNLRRALVRVGHRTREECPPPTLWEFYTEWGMTRESFDAWCDYFTNNGELFWKGDPYPGVREQLLRLREAGHTIVLITSRAFGTGTMIQTATRNWLAGRMIPYDELHFAKDKTAFAVDYHIDDNWDHHIAMRAAGVDSWLLRCPHNAKHLSMNAVVSLTQYVSIVLDREERAAEHNSEDYWKNERQDILDRFLEELGKATGDGSKKRQAGEKPPWFEDHSHEGAIFSHLTKWKRGEQVDPDSGAHPLVHAAWRCLAIACRESGNVPHV